jgi:hypothetical protein
VDTGALRDGGVMRLVFGKGGGYVLVDLGAAIGLWWGVSFPTSTA